MKEKSFQVVKEFLDRHLSLDASRPILLGFSGGSDSMALLHLLLECKAFFSLNIHLAHVDHGWRPESAEEASRLAKSAQDLKVPFHLHVLQERPECNLEEDARKQRLKFFAEIYKELNGQALVLAHHRDDQSETVLKRVLEGADLYALGAMRESCPYYGMTLWRPLLSLPKQTLLDYLNKRNILFIDDATNRDPRFLRARMRVKLFPDLAKVFGKEIGKNLSRLGDSASAFSQYLDGRIAPFWTALKVGPEEISIDFAPFFPLERVELNAFLRRLMKQEGVQLSYAQLATLQDLIITQVTCRQIPILHGEITINRGFLAIKRRLVIGSS
jgi:tRNA(Ile)-lysidine synthase